MKRAKWGWAIAAAVVAGSASASHAALSLSLSDNDPSASNYADDGALGVNEYSASYSNGGGSGFGGTLGAGTFYFDADATNLYIGFDPGANLNDNVALFLDSRTGGFSDAQMNDQADDGRRAVSNLAGNADDSFPISPDFGIAIGDFGVVIFELNAGNTPGHLSFISFEGDQTTNSSSLIREFEIPLSTLGNPTEVNFFAGYVADDGFGSNESLPASTALNSGSNVGTSNTSAGYADYNQFVIVPEPASLALAALGLPLMLRRRR